jgi:hypothetical protein
MSFSDAGHFAGSLPFEYGGQKEIIATGAWMPGLGANHVSKQF